MLSRKDENMANDEVKTLITKLTGRDAWSAKKAYETLKTMAADKKINLSKHVVKPLIKMLKNKDTQTGAAKYLGEFGDPQALKPLIALLSDKDSLVRRAAADALGSLGDQRATAPLIKLGLEKDDYLRMGAARALGKIGGPGAVDALIVILKDEDRVGAFWERNKTPFLRQVALSALGELGDPKAVPNIIKLLDDPYDRVQVYARTALGRFDTPEAKFALQPKPVKVEKPVEFDGNYAKYRFTQTSLGNPLDLEVRTERICIYCTSLSDPNLRDPTQPRGIAECANHSSGQSVVNFDDTCELWAPNYKVRYWLSRGYMLHNQDGWPRTPWYQVFDDGPDGEKGTH